jgi:hypothetical protein
MNTEVLRNFFVYAEYPMESLEHETYLNIYWAIKKLFMDGRYSREDILILENYLMGYSQRELSNILNLDRRYITKRLKYILYTLSSELEKNE